MLSRILRSLLRRQPGQRAMEQGHAALRRNDWRAAESGFRHALSSGQDSAGAFHGLGVALWEQGRLDEGLQALQLAVDRAPREAEYRLWLALALEKTAPGEAVEHLREARALAPQSPHIDSRLHKPLMEVCAWDELDAAVSDLEARARTEPPELWTLRLDAYVAQLLPIAPPLRREAVRQHALRAAKEVVPVARQPRPSSDGRCRLGYVAAEFRDHATAHLAAGLFERHERARFEVVAYSWGKSDGSEYEQRLNGAFDRFVDLRGVSDADAARRIAEDGIDILVDLKGYTSAARPGIFARRPAPVQVNYLGYPGSMQAQFIDYVIADATVIPSRHFEWFSEAVVWLPGSYQPNDDRQLIAQSTPSRTDQGLPEHGFVYCCFNRSYKIERAVFGAWMRVLAAVPGSVLWLLWSNEATKETLCGAAARAGVDPARLVFARRLPKPMHLARHRLADLFLDTYTVNAHTTGSDALWAGLPLLTRPGESFSSRVGASLLHAVGLEELVVATLADYERTAIELGRDRERLAALRARLARNRLTMPLFRTEQYTRQLEAAFQAMQARDLRGARPEAFAV